MTITTDVTQSERLSTYLVKRISVYIFSPNS